MTLDEAGIKGRHMVYLSGHKSEYTIKEYTNKVPEKKKGQMYAILADNAGYPAPKVSKTKLNSNVNDEQLENMVAIPQTSNTNQSNNPTFDLSNIDLLEFDEKSDQMLVEFLNQNEKLLQVDQPQPLQNQTQNNQNVQNTMVSKPTNFPIVPRMYFPHSNVTINYNFNSK